MIPNIRTNHCPHCKAQAGVIDAQAEVMAALQADKAKLREALRRISIGDGIGGPDAELQCADIARKALQGTEQ